MSARRRIVSSVVAESFRHVFEPEFFAGLLSGAIVLGLGYLVVDERLRLKQRADEEQDAAGRRAELRSSALAIVEAELTYGASLLQTWRTVLTGSADDLPHPGFEINGWYLVTQGPVLAALRPQTSDLLMGVYNRMRTANDQLAFLADLTYGQSALSFAIARATGSDHHGVPNTPMIAELVQLYETHRERRRADLVWRLENLKPLLDDAIDAVERENGTFAGVPASQRDFSLINPVLGVRAGAGVGA